MHSPHVSADDGAFLNLRERHLSRIPACVLTFGIAIALTGCGVTAGPGIPGIFPTAHTQLWLQQFGAQPLNSSFNVLGYGPEAIANVAVDPSGNVIGGGYAAGQLAGNLPGSTTNQGESDAYLVKYSPSGTKIWSEQVSTGSADLITGVTTDSAGNIFAVDATAPPGSNTLTVTVAKTDPSGSPQWSYTLPPTGVNVLGQVVKCDHEGNVLVAGFSFAGGEAPQTLFLAKLSGTDGTPLWLQTFQNTPLSLISAMAIDPQDNILATGASVGPGIAFVAKILSSGSLAWVQVLNSPGNVTSAFGVASDAQGNAIVGGATSPTNVAVGYQVIAGEEAFISKYAADGTPTPVWSYPVSTGLGDVITSVQVAADGTILAAGLTNGILARSFVQPAQNVFIAKFAADATHISAQQFGTGPLVNTASYFQPQIALDTQGNLFISGATTGAFPTFTNTSNALQMFIAKFGPQ